MFYTDLRASGCAERIAALRGVLKRMTTGSTCVVSLDSKEALVELTSFITSAKQELLSVEDKLTHYLCTIRKAR